MEPLTVPSSASPALTSPSLSPEVDRITERAAKASRSHHGSVGSGPFTPQPGTSPFVP